jgi:uncharacterized protein (UPF0333 family)
MTIYALHGFCSIAMFFSLSIIIICVLGKNKIKLINKMLKKIDDTANYVIIAILITIFLTNCLLWSASAVVYLKSDNFTDKDYSAGYAIEKYNDLVEKYNEKYDANIKTHDDFTKFAKSQWNFGNYVRNIGYLIIIVFYLIMVFIELNTNKLERKLEKIRKSICELSNIPNPDDQTKQILDLLSKTKKKLEKQIQLKSVSKSIKMLKQIQADESAVDITREIDELTALYQLNETDLLKEKYQ